MDEHAILQHLGVGVLVVDVTGRVTFDNEESRRILGTFHTDWCPEDLFGHYEARLRDRVTPVTAEGSLFARALCGEGCDDLELFLCSPSLPDGALVSITARPIRNAAGVLSGAVFTFRDITAQASLHDSFERERALTALVGRVAAAANEAPDLPFALQTALDAVCAYGGWQLGHAWGVDELSGAPVSTGVWHCATGEASAAVRTLTEATRFGVGDGIMGRVRRGRAPAWIADVRDDPDVLRAEGLAAAGCLSCLAVPVLAGGEVTGMLEFFGTTSEPPNDAVLGAMGLVGVQLGRVFERDRARRRERFVQSVVDHVADPIFVKDNSFRFVFLSRALCEMVGQAPEKMLGRDDYDFFPKEQADFFRAKDQEMFTSESRVVIEEEPITDAAGRHHVLATTKVPLRDDAGKVTHLVGVIHDITQLKAVQDELRLKNQLLAAQVAEKTTALAQLAVAHEELEAFTYTVSHDLRAPLASISGFTELVLASAGVALGPVNRGYLQRARAAVDRMARLMDDLLQLSQMGRQPMHLEPVDLAVIAREVVADLRRTDPERHVDVVVREPMAVVGDPPLLRVVLENLLGNAWKFTARQAHARVEVGAAKVGGAFACYVRDNGAGFEMADAARLFQPFQRLHRSDEFAGTGVGLASVRRIVERHGGRVWAEGAVSEGADIWFTLPEAPGAQA